MIYAQIDENNICIATATSQKESSQLPNNWILIENEFEAVGKRYNNGVWEEVEQPEPEEPQPTNADILAALQKSHEELKQEAIDNYTMELIEQGIL